MSASVRVRLATGDVRPRESVPQRARARATLPARQVTARAPGHSGRGQGGHYFFGSGCIAGCATALGPVAVSRRLNPPQISLTLSKVVSGV